MGGTGNHSGPQLCPLIEGCLAVFKGLYVSVDIIVQWCFRRRTNPYFPLRIIVLRDFVIIVPLLRIGRYPPPLRPPFSRITQHHIQYNKPIPFIPIEVIDLNPPPRGIPRTITDNGRIRRYSLQSFIDGTALDCGEG